MNDRQAPSRSNSRRRQRFISTRRWTGFLSLALILTLSSMVFSTVSSVFPESFPGVSVFRSASAQALVPTGEDDSAIDVSEIEAVMNDAPEEATEQQLGSDQPSGIDLLSLISRGGWFMAPIGLMSMLVVTLAVERTLSLRTSKVIPPRLVSELGDLAASHEHFPPSTAFEVCQENRSATGRVITAMLMRTGQPLGEIERTATETIQREADRYASPVRWLTLAAAATPLMGLLGTVWGMIVAFHESSTLTADRSRSEQLSEGIYTALVTTLAGLVVAIPAAMFAQYLENKITKLFHRIEELAFAVAPGLVRFTGRSRMDHDGNLRPLDGAPPPIGGSPGPPINAPQAPPMEKSYANGSATSPPPIASPS